VIRRIPSKSNLFGANTATEEQTRRNDAILAEEDSRRSADATKTERLREQRLAREAAERKAVKPEPMKRAKR
jgi:hypothetical protein